MLRSLLLSVAAVALTAAGCGTTAPETSGPQTAQDTPADSMPGPEAPVTVALPPSVPMTDTVGPGGRRMAGHAEPGTGERLALGASVQRHGQTVRFVRVAEDSRCPEGLTCVWGGKVSADIQIGDEVVRMTVPYAGMEDTEVPFAERGMLQVQLVAVTPYPGSAEAEAGAEPEVELVFGHAGM